MRSLSRGGDRGNIVGRFRGVVIIIIRKTQDFERAGPMGETANKTAFLKPGDQAMNAGFGFQAQGFFHLVKRGRDAMIAKVIIDIDQQFVLLARQHDFFRTSNKNKPNT